MPACTPVRRPEGPLDRRGADRVARRSVVRHYVGASAGTQEHSTWGGRMRRQIRDPSVRRSAFVLPLGAALLGLIPCRSDTPEEPSAPLFTTAVNRVVNSAADPGTGGCTASECTLREAINAAGTTAITFAAGLTGPITLAKPTNGGGELLIGSSLSITGPSGGMVIQRASSSPNHRVFDIGAGATVTLTNLTVRSGKIATGGGILNAGMLSLNGTTVSGNSATQGGGIYN